MRCATARLTNKPPNINEKIIAKIPTAFAERGVVIIAPMVIQIEAKEVDVNTRMLEKIEKSTRLSHWPVNMTKGTANDPKTMAATAQKSPKRQHS